MEMVGQSALQILIVAARQSGGDEASVAAGRDRTQAIDFVRQDPARFRRLDFKGRNQKDKAQARIDRKFLMPILAGDDKATKLCGRGVVGMTFQLGTKPEDLGAPERTIEEGIERVEHAEPDRDTAAESTGARDPTLDHAGKWEGLALGRAEESAGGFLGHRARFEPGGARDRDEVMNLQGDTEAIKAGAEIRSGSGNVYRDLLLFQRESPENGGERTMVALILTRALPTARRGRKSG